MREKLMIPNVIVPKTMTQESVECHSVSQAEEAYNLLCSMTADNDTLLLKGLNRSGIWKIADLFFGKD